MTITPDQLPNKASNFIAYGNEERAANPAKDGEVLTVRPQVYVRYYPNLVVSNLVEGGRSGDRAGLLTVHFDPASVGFTNAISAHMNNDDRTVHMLRHSFETKTPVAVAIETQRKKKNSRTGEQISPLTHIHALRGATHANGDGPAAALIGPTGENTSNRVAFVNGIGTQHIVTNPSEWKSLINNKAGDLPPEGWRNFAPGPTWKEAGAAIRDTNAPFPAPLSAPAAAPTPHHTPAGGSFPNANQLGTLVHDIVTQALKDFAPALINQLAQGQDTTQAVRPSGKFSEGKPWNPRTSDNRINLGGYVVSSERWVFEWAFKHLTETLKATVPAEDAWALADSVLKMASNVQSAAYGHGFAADRSTASHREAEHWVQWVIEHTLPFPGLDADEGTLSGWAEEVTAEAASHLGEAGRRAGEYFTSVSKRDKNGAAPKESPAPEQSGPSEKVVRAFLDVIQKGWNNAATIKAMGTQGRDKGYGALQVSLVITDSGVEISHPPVEGAKSGPLDSLLIHRHKALTAAEGATTQTQAPEAADATPAQEPAPEAAPAPTATATPQPHPAQDIIDALATVGTEQDLRGIYETARDADLLATLVHVAPGPNGSVVFGQPGQSGFKAQTIGSVVGIIRNILAQASNNAAPATTEAEGQPAQGQQPPASSAPEAASTEAAPAPQVEAADSEAQRIADAAEQATTPEEIAELRKTCEENNLTEALVTVNGLEGALMLWLTKQDRRIKRAQSKRQ